MVLAIALAGLAILLLPGHQAHAQSIASVAGGAIGYMAFIFLLIVSTIAGLLITFFTFLIGIILQLSNNVVNTFAVQNGFTVTLAVANLGFVLAIIIIAIATILRRENYAVKKTLWKLVVAAILVNFSLVIGGAIITFANTFTNAFLNQLPNFQGGPGPIDFAQQLAGAFSPQRAYIDTLFSSSTQASAGTSGFWSTIINSISAAAGPVGMLISSVVTNGQPGQDIASILTPLVEVFCAVSFLIVILITLAVFLFMLLIRYVELAILLILMPFAWLMWILPKTAHLWSRWWNEFIRWTFFAPIVVFFLWLAIATAQQMNTTTAASGDFSFLAGAQFQAQTDGILGGAAGAFKGFVGTFAVTMLQGVVVIGLAIGGMIVANKLSIMGAQAGMGAMKSAGNAVQGWAGRRTKQVVTSPLRTQFARNLSTQMQQRTEIAGVGGALLRGTGIDFLKKRAGR